MIINEITIRIIRNARDGESIRSLANKIGFAYSAVYGCILKLEKYEVIRIIRKGNKNIIKINNKNTIYNKFRELDNVVSVIDKNNEFWEFIKNTKLRIRFVMGTAITIWTKGGFITGDFYDKIYFLEAVKKDITSLKKDLLVNRYSTSFYFINYYVLITFKFTCSITSVIFYVFFYNTRFF